MESVAPWFYCPDLHPGENLLAEEEAHHAAAAKRLTVGSAVTLFDGMGGLGSGRITSAGRHSLGVAVADTEFQEPPAREITVAVALPKGKRWQLLVEKLTELGAVSIVPVRFSRSVVSGSEPENARRWAREACKQCRRAALPVIAPEISLDVWLADSAREFTASQTLFLAAPGGASPELPPRYHGKTACIIGPEGGLTADETAACVAAGARPVTLGPHILRIETAAMAATALLMNA